MTFQSLDFAIFLPIVFIVHWYVGSGDIRKQNLLLLAASLFFYGWWDYRFLGLLLTVSLANFFMAIAIESTMEKSLRSRLLWLGVLSNLCLLFVFKYYNFFVTNFVGAFSLLGTLLPLGTLDLILPLGISFYTFQSLGYLIDVYRKRFPAVREPVIFMCFMTFFPKITAGPIERASGLIPQLAKARVYDQDLAVDGLRRILLGLFMKVVVADNLGVILQRVFQSGPSQSGSNLLLGMLAMPMRVYADFAGYSEMAIGTAALFGIRLMRNFSFPFFATNIVMLWQRWHISLTGWFRDYVFMVLPARRSSRWILVRNISFIYLLSGFWHGASWSYLAWGIMNALFIAYYLYFFHFEKRRLFTRPVLGMVSTYFLFSFTMLCLSGDSLVRSLSNLSRILSSSLFKAPDVFMDRAAAITMFFASILLAMDWASRNGGHGMTWVERLSSRPLRWMIYATLAMLVFMFSGNRQPFIYMRF
jgi:alginate O-acetyltransferase complex protein AlgI